MEIKLKNTTTNERELRFYYDLSTPMIKKAIEHLKLKMRFKKRVASDAMSIANAKREIEIRNHPDYEQYHKEWLVVQNERLAEWAKENEQLNNSIDRQVEALLKKKKPTNHLN